MGKDRALCPSVHRPRRDRGPVRTAASYRGQPLAAFLLLLGGWVAVRAMVWDLGDGGQTPLDRLAPVLQVEAAIPAAAPPSRPLTADAASRSASQPAGAPASDWPGERFPPRPAPQLITPRPHSPLMPPLPPARGAPVPMAMVSPVSAQVSAGHQLLWMAALSSLPLPPGLRGQPAPLRSSAISRPSAAGNPAASPESDRPVAYRDARWSADAWLLLRRGGTVSSASGIAPATYGASQTGAVVRYRLAPTSPRRPSLYLRGSAALNGSREREAAFGASARPIPGLPVVAAVEARVNRQPSGTRARPAAFAYTELPPVALPGEGRAEFYAQAGYVGGDFASAFADGQLRVDRKVLQLGRGELRAGGGVWGGAQKGASRLDIGPAATVGMPLGESVGARLGVDWRFRVAGDAAPTSGPAVTLSAGF